MKVHLGSWQLGLRRDRVARSHSREQANSPIERTLAPRLCTDSTSFRMNLYLLIGSPVPSWQRIPRGMYLSFFDGDIVINLGQSPSACQAWCHRQSFGQNMNHDFCGLHSDDRFMWLISFKEIWLFASALLSTFFYRLSPPFVILSIRGNVSIFPRVVSLDNMWGDRALELSDRKDLSVSL